MDTRKTYLGDAVYVEHEAGMIKLTTENGISVTNTIYLEPRVWAALLKWVEQPAPAEDPT